MSFLKDKLGRSAVVVAFSLGAFQALSLVGATAAHAVSTCSFSGGVVTVSAPDDGDTIKVYQDINGGIHVAGGVAGAQPALGADLAGCTGVQFGVATTTTINITGATGAGAFDQKFYVELTQTTAGVLNTTLANWGAINWVVNGGNNSPAGDLLQIQNSGLTTAPINLAGGANGIDLNNDGDLDLTYANVENFTVLTNSNANGQNIDLSGSTATGAAFPADASILATSTGDLNTFLGGDGDDTLTNTVDGDGDTFSPGLGSDQVNCGPGLDDTVDYSNTTTAINMNLAIFTVTQGTDLDTVLGCVNGIGTDQGDTMIGDAQDNVFMPGAGNDTVTGGLAGEVTDTYDVSDATEGVTVDLTAGTSTGGSGTDTLSQIENVVGGSGGDSLTGDAGANALFGGSGNDTLAGGAGDGDGNDLFDGGSGVDTIDYSANTLDTTVDLTIGGGNGAGSENDTIVPNTIENARLGSGDDFFDGSAFNNIVFPGGGQNAVNGHDGIDTVNYSYGYTAGVTINMTGGGAAGGSQDAIENIENAVGTEFNDSIFGTDVVASTNGANLLVGGKGKDSISGNAGPDLIRGNAGNDSIRGGAGDDTILAQDGKDNVRGSGGADDINGGKGKDYCNGGGGNDFIKNCEKPKHNGHGPNGHNLHRQL